MRAKQVPDLRVAAMGAMLDRIRHPGLPAREILLDCELMVRQSCGAPT